MALATSRTSAFSDSWLRRVVSAQRCCVAAECCNMCWVTFLSPRRIQWGCSCVTLVLVCILGPGSVLQSVAQGGHTEPSAWWTT